MVYAAFPNANDFDIWFKPYPYTPIEMLFAELKINIQQSGYKIVNEDIAKLLEQATIVFVQGSTVAVEAIAYRCTVIVPNFADVMQLNPLVGLDVDYFLVETATQLKEVIERKINRQDNLLNSKSKEFLHHFWNLDPTLPMWEKLFSL